MSLITKIFTAIRGGAREIGQNIVDKNSIRIFEQEIADAENALGKAKYDLTSVIAQEMQASRKIKELSEKVSTYEVYAENALEKNDEALALEVAEKIAEFSSELEIQKKAKESFTNHAERLKDMIKKTAKSLTDMKRQLVMVKTTESVQKATAAITSNYASGSSSLLTAKESLDRIKKNQEMREDRLKAGEVLDKEFNNTTNLEDKLKNAGIIEVNNKAQDILAKIKAKKSNK